MYRDGGTISVKCNIGGPQWSKYLHDHHMPSDEMLICLDGRSGKEPKIWLGYPDSDGSQVIVEKELIDDLLKKIESFKQTQNWRIDQFLNFEASVRDWKIKNILDVAKKV